MVVYMKNFTQIIIVFTMILFLAGGIDLVRGQAVFGPATGYAAEKKDKKEQEKEKKKKKKKKRLLIKKKDSQAGSDKKITPQKTKKSKKSPAKKRRILKKKSTGAASKSEAAVKKTGKKGKGKREKPYGDNLRSAAVRAGGTGLWRVSSADSSPIGTLQLGISSDFFTSTDFLIEGDTTSRARGKLSLTWSAMEHFETWFSLGSSSTRNDMSHYLGSNNMIQAMGEMELGFKGYYRPVESLQAAMILSFGFLPGAGEISFDLASTRIKVNPVVTWNTIEIYPQVPLRTHLNLGFVFQNNDQLMERKINKVEEFALEVHAYNRFTPGLGLEFPLEYVTPFIEYNLDIPLGVTGDDLYKSKLGEPGEVVPISELLSQALTFGARITALKDITFLFAVEVGFSPVELALTKQMITGQNVTNLPPAMGNPKVANYNIILGACYVWDPVVRDKEVIKIKTVKLPPPAPKFGTFKGKVIDSKTKKPLGHVIVSPKKISGLYPFASHSRNGKFSTGQMVPPGIVKFTFKKDGYFDRTVAIKVAAGLVTPMKVAMKPAPPKGLIKGKITDGLGAPVIANITLKGPKKYEQKSSKKDGQFEMEVLAGTYKVVISAKKYVDYTGRLEIKKDDRLIPIFPLIKRPTSKHIIILENKIEVRQEIHFKKGKASLMAKSNKILSQVVDILKQNPQIKKLKIEGHTDNRGKAKFNKYLSQKRAEAVLDYLVNNGVEATRLTAVGYGAEMPIASNRTRSGRKKNRRVEFIIEE